MGAARSRWRWAILGLALASGGAWYGSRSAAGPKVPVVRATRQDLVQKVVVSGRVSAPARINLGATLPGTVSQVVPEEGVLVKAGELLVRLDDQELSASVAQAKAGVDQASAKLAQLRQVGSRLAREGFRQAQLSADQAQRKQDRLESLAKAGSATQSELEDARSARELAESKLGSAEVQAKSLTPGGAEYRLAQAALAQAEAALAATEARLAQTRLVAPVDAVVLHRRVEPGDSVQPGRTLLVLARSGATFLAAQPDEKNLALLSPGQQALASSDAFPSQTFTAQVASVAPSIDAERGTVEVKFKVPEPPDYLRPEMTVSIEVEVARRTQVVVLSAEAVRDLPVRKPWVMALRDGMTERQPVKVGVIGDGLVEITEGLAPGALVVPITPAPLNPGQKVRALPSPGS